MLRRRRRPPAPSDPAPEQGATPEVAPGPSAEDLAAYRTIAEELRQAVLAGLPAWLQAQVTNRAPGIDPAATAGVVDGVRATVERRLAELLAADPGEQRTTPLTVLRSSVAPVTELLRDAGVPPAQRDEVEARLAPEDVYGIGPAAFADLGPEVAEAGLRWGAAVAHIHLATRRAIDAERGCRPPGDA